MVVLEESSLVLGFSKTFLVDLKMSSELLQSFANILQKVLEHFLHSSSLVILAQILARFDCLHSSQCNLSWKFSVIVLNSGKFLSLCLGPFLCKVEILEKDGARLFLVQDFVYSKESLVEEWLFHIFKLKKQLFAYEDKICLPEQKFVKHYEASNFCVCREPYQ